MPRTVSCLLSIFAVLTLAAFTVVAQQIQGEVRYADSGQPAIGALVHCNGTGGTSEQLTDRSGRFYFRVSPGHYTVNVSVPGYRGNDQSVDLLDTRASEYMFFRIRREDSGKKTVSPPSTVDASVPSEAQKEFDKGEAALATDKKGSMEEGALHLEKAVTIYPKFLQAQLRLGTVYMDLQQWDKAQQALRRALEIDPKAANAMFALGEIYLRQKKDDDAEKVLLQGLQVEDRSFQGHLILARVYVDMAAKIKDDTQNRPLRVKAYDQVNEALKYNADLAQAHFIKGNLLLSVGRDQDAQHEYEEYLRLDPKGPFADKAKGWIEKIKKALAEKKP